MVHIRMGKHNAEVIIVKDVRIRQHWCVVRSQRRLFKIEARHVLHMIPILKVLF